MTFIHFFMREPLWVREDLYWTAGAMILGWVIIGLVIYAVVRFFKRLASKKEIQK